MSTLRPDDVNEIIEFARKGIISGGTKKMTRLLDYIEALEAENAAIGKALLDFRPFRYQTMSNLEAVLDLIRDDEAQS